MLYHANIGLPKIQLPPMMDLHYSKHAVKASKDDRYGSIELQHTLDTRKAKVVEIETSDYSDEPLKVLVRQSYDDKFDICTVISMTNKIEDRFVVKTVWLNEKIDNHRTLDYSKYDRPKQVS